LASSVSNFNISGNNVVWSGFDGSDYEIYLNNGSSTIQLTDNNSNDSSNPKISGNNVVWAGFDGTNSLIYLYNGSSTIQLSDNGSNPGIFDNNIVWTGYDGSDYEIYLYNGSSTIQLTDNSSQLKEKRHWMKALALSMTAQQVGCSLMPMAQALLR
jgi:beta propeller repeat protein